jgi:hypothetical protein
MACNAPPGCYHQPTGDSIDHEYRGSGPQELGRAGTSGGHRDIVGFRRLGLLATYAGTPLSLLFDQTSDCAIIWTWMQPEAYQT